MLRKQDAEKQAQTIRDYWAERGFKVRVTVKEMEAPIPQVKNPEIVRPQKFFVVRSNMIDGLPREMKRNAA